MAGIDGCRGGWVVATVPANGSLAHGVGPSVRVVTGLDGVVAALGSSRVAAAAIDIPIGLPAVGPRACDREARAALGPRRSSVFPAPVRAALGAGSYAEACAVSRAVCGKALPKQLYNIVDKIREVDELQSPARQYHLFEACPELSFALMNGGEPMQHNKHTAQGRAERVTALHAVRGGLIQISSSPPRGARTDDVLDALALAWTARRYVAGSVRRFGGQLDETGLRMEIIA